MAKKQKTRVFIVSEPETAYFTKRTLERALSKATRHITQDAMQRMGYVITVKRGWLVKEYSNGTRERVSKIPKVKTPRKIVLD